MGSVAEADLAFASLLLFLFSSTQVAHRMRSLRGLAGRFVIPDLDGIPSHVVGAIAPLIAAASQLPIAYVLILREHELSLVAAVLLLGELYIAAAWMAHLTEARRHVRDAIRRYEEQRRMARMLSGYRRP